MQPKGMEDLAAFSAREAKRAAAEERERDKYSSADKVVIMFMPFVIRLTRVTVDISITC